MAPFAACHGIVFSVTSRDTARAVGHPAAALFQSRRECSAQDDRNQEHPPPSPCAPKTPPPIAPERGTARGSGAVPLVVTAELCKDLSTSGKWRCVAAGNPAGPGRALLLHADQVSDRHTVLHRWYRGDRLRQSVELSVQPNTKDGYRTFSRNTVDSRSAGDWKVELRTKDGVLLHEERFVVR